MQTISLTGNKGFSALVDDEDYEWLSRRLWSVKVGSDGVPYAVEAIRHGVAMHREILGLVRDDGFEGDHRNHNTLDNQRHNLRIATSSQNKANCRLVRRNNRTGFKGVAVDSTHVTKPYRATISFESRTIHVGRYADVVTAARAYDAKALELFGSYACVNFPS